MNGTLALICFLGFFSCQMGSLVLHFKMVEAINSKRTAEEKLDMFGFIPHPMSFWKLTSIYRACFPGGGLVRSYWLVTLAGLACLVSTAIFLFRS